MDAFAAADRALLDEGQAEIEARHPAVLAWTLSKQMPEAQGPLRVAMPRTPNEKMAWRKIFDRDPRFVTVSDRLQAKRWVAKFGLGSARVLWRGRSAARIPRALLGGPAVLKANHGCGTNLFLRDGRPPRGAVIRRADAFLLRDHWRPTHEWGFQGIERRLFLEEMLGGPDRPLLELKIYTFGRKVERIIAIADRFGDMAAARWLLDEAGVMHRSATPTAISDRILEDPLPPSTGRALAVARRIGARFDHMRVDLLTDGEQIWLGELTVYSFGGCFPDCGHDPDCASARLWDLRRSWFLRTRHDDPRLAAYAAALLHEIGRQEGAAGR